MQFRRVIGLFLVIFTPLLTSAQNPDDAAAKERQRIKAMIIDQVIAELPNVVLGENRAFVSAKVGNLLWGTDEKRARAMFQNAAAELIDAQDYAEANQKRMGNQNDLISGGSIRSNILNIIAARDAEMALDLLVKTRPSMIAKALAAPAASGAKITNSGNYVYLAQNEINLEQSFTRMAADQNPERAIKLLNDALSKDITNETLSLLKKLHEKDRDAARDFAAKVIDKLNATNLTVNGQPNNQILQIAVNFLTDFSREKKDDDKTFRFNDTQMRALAAKIIGYYLENASGQGSYISYALVPIAEKLSPANVERLKSLAKNNPSRGDWGWNDPELQKLFNGESTADQLLDAAKKYPENARPQIYQRAVGKLMQQGDVGRATSVINDSYAGEALDDAMRNLNAQYANNLMSEGKFAEAERLIDELPENARFNPLINLANAIYQKDQVGNKSYAVAVLEKTRALFPDRPETQNDMSNLTNLINTYLNVEPTEAFRMYRGLIPQINELADASAVINPFQGNNNARNGEFIMSQGNVFGFYGSDASIIGNFARKDIDQTTLLIDSFSRRETRILLKLQIAESLN